MPLYNYQICEDSHLCVFYRVKQCRAYEIIFIITANRDIDVNFNGVALSPCHSDLNVSVVLTLFGVSGRMVPSV